MIANAPTNMLSQFKAARRVSTPLVAVHTPDPAATITHLCDGINNKTPKFTWDICRGYRSRSDQSRDILAKLVGDVGDVTEGNPEAAVMMAVKLPPRSIVFIHQADRYLNSPYFVQAIWILRDQFKLNRRTLVLLAPSMTLPPELAGDVFVLDEPLPDQDQLTAIVKAQHKAAGLEVDADTLDNAVEAVQGLPAFPVEQVVAMSLTKQGLDVDALWERKRRQIELTPGLKVHRGGEGFGDIGGVEVVKGYLQRIMSGHNRPNAVVFVDEIEKMLSGAAAGQDTSGVAQDQLGSLLSYMQDQQAAGMIFVGPPGSAKSMVAKAAGNAGGVPTIQLDLGAAKGSLVGQSEQQLRNALKVVTHVSNGRSLWIATCNAIGSLPPELRRRFTLGTFFFDLPDATERAVIWGIQLGAYGLSKPRKDAWPDDDGWTGAEIRQCCEIAWRLSVPLRDAAEFVVPVSRSAADQIQSLRKSAQGRFLSASHSGVYQFDTDAEQAADANTRTLDLSEDDD